MAKRLKTSPIGRRLQSCAIDEHDLPGILPIIGFRYQPSANGILPDVIPFVSVAFIVAEDIIEKAALPDRRGLWRNLFRESLFQHSYPWPELKIIGSADEKMKVIGHDYIPTNGNVLLQMRARSERCECGVHCIGCEQFPPLVCTKCDEEQGIVNEDPPQARRQFWISAHANLVAASLWEAQCRCSLAARHVAHRATATDAATPRIRSSLEREHVTAIY